MTKARPTEGIAVDASHSEKNQVTEFQGVDIATGETLFRKSIGFQTVNIGEFLGIVEAVKYIIENRFLPMVVYSDSTTAITWFNSCSAPSSKRNMELGKAEIFLKLFSSDISAIEVRHWNNSEFGETPADFGRK